MTKLHELIAVESDLKGNAQKVLSAIKSALSKSELFTGSVRTYQPAEEMGEKFPDEKNSVVKTVREILSELSSTYGSWVDVSVQKEISNRETSADVIVDGKVLFHDLPSTALLNLESKLDELKAIYAALPVLDTAEQWTFDAGLEEFVSSPRTTFRTKKVIRNHVKYEATKEHPAQVDVYTEDVRAGTWTTVIHSGAVTAKDKREMIARVEKLLMEVKKARQRANSCDAVLTNISSSLFDYINTGKVS